MGHPTLDELTHVELKVDISLLDLRKDIRKFAEDKVLRRPIDDMGDHLSGKYNEYIHARGLGFTTPSWSTRYLNELESHDYLRREVFPGKCSGASINFNFSTSSKSYEIEVSPRRLDLKIKESDANKSVSFMQETHLLYIPFSGKGYLDERMLNFRLRKEMKTILSKYATVTQPRRLLLGFL